MSDESPPLHLAAGHIPLAVFVAVQAALAVGAGVEVEIRGAPGVSRQHGARPWRNVVRAFLERSVRPDAVESLKAAGFRWAGNQWKWTEARHT